jgi:hypothetical protein
MHQKAFNTRITPDDIWVLRRLHNVGYKSAIIAGGAVRDHYLKTRINDIDIYVQTNGSSNELIMTPFHDLKAKSTLKALFDLNLRPDLRPVPRHKRFDATSQAYPVLASNPLKGEASGAGVDGVKAIMNVMKNGIKYQIISVNEPTIDFVMDRFHLNFSRCYCDGIKMRYTNEFLTDFRHKTLTITGKLTEAEYNYGMHVYLPKIQRRFPNFTVVDLLHDKYK